MNGRPSHRAYTVEDRAGDQSDQPGFWTRIGSAWPHKDGKGLNIVMNSHPAVLDCKEAFQALEAFELSKAETDREPAGG